VITPGGATSSDPGTGPLGAMVRRGVDMARGKQVRVVKGDPADADTLRSAGVVGSDAVVMASPSGWAAQDEDAGVVSTALALRGLLDEPGAASPHTFAHKHAGGGSGAHAERPLNFVCCVREERTRDVLRLLVGTDTAAQAQAPAQAQHGQHPHARRHLTLDVVLADDLLSGMLTQVASDTLLQGVFEDLCSEAGKELYVRAPAAYDIPVGQQLRWGEVQERARANEDVAIGYIDRWGEVVLDLPADAIATLQEGERLVVIGDQ